MHTVLIVEDDHQIRVTLRQALETEGFFVFSAANGIDGLAMLKRIKPPCVVLLDRLMPMLDGDGFLKIKNEDPQIAAVPVIIVSGSENHGDLPKIKEFLKKPLDLDAVIRAIKKYCGEHQQ